jgi:hypothetical protein
MEPTAGYQMYFRIERTNLSHMQIERAHSPMEMLVNRVLGRWMHCDLEWRISDKKETKIDTHALSKPASKWKTMTTWDDNGDHTSVEAHKSTTGSVGIKFDWNVVKMKKYVGLLRVR